MSRILVEGIGLKENHLTKILGHFVVPYRPINATMRHLSIGNICISKSLKDLIFDQLIPQLFSLDIYNIRMSKGLRN